MIKIEKSLIEIPVELFKNIILEPTIEFDNGIKIISFDSASACMCIFELSKDKILEYNLTEQKKCKINLELFDKCLKRIKTKFILLDFNNERLIISDENNKKKYEIVVYHDNEEEVRTIPTFNFNSSFNMSSKDFCELMSDAFIVSSDCKFETLNTDLILSANEQNKYYSKTEKVAIGNEFARYSLEYINKFMNASKYFKDILFEFAKDSPCQLTFQNDDLKIKFILASKIFDD